MIDYRSLLVRFMAGVMDAENVSFIGLCACTDEERIELTKIENECKSALALEADDRFVAALHAAGIDYGKHDKEAM